MHSMTGFGRGEATGSGASCVIECASVNRKGLEVACQLPRELAALEAVIREAVSKRVTRGRVNVSITLASGEADAAIEIDQPLARALLDQIRKLQKKLNLAGNVDVNTLLNIPGVIRAPQRPATAFESLVLQALTTALDALESMRRKEGRSLQRDLSKRLAVLRKARARMAQLAPEIVQRYRADLLARLERNNLTAPVDETRLATEIALFAERCDVSEELTRLASHFDQFEEKLAAAEPVGRALEFLTQEIYRELNTLGSKAGDSALTRLVVDSKVELDKIREQILNVE